MSAEIHRAIVRARTPVELYESVCRAAGDFGHFRLVWVGTLDPESGELRLESRAADGAGFPHLICAAECGIARTAIAQGTPFVCNVLSVDQSQAPCHPQAMQSDIGSCAAFPIHREGTVIGVLCLHARDEGFFSPTVVGLLEEVAFSVSISLDRMRAEARVQESERRFRLICESTSDVFWLWNVEEARFTFISPAVERLIGYRAEEIYNLGLRDLLPEESCSYLISDLDRRIKAFEEGNHLVRTQTHQVDQRRKDGTLVPTEIVSSLILGESGRVRLVQGVTRDITELRRNLHALRRSEERYRLLTENSADAIFLTIPDGTILQANSAACRMFGRTLEEFRLWGRSAVVDFSDPRLAEALEERRRTGRFTGELRFVRKDGSVFPGEITAVQFTDTEGEPRVSMTVRDITAQKRDRDALQASEERFRQIIESATVGYFRIDGSGRFESVNRAWLEMHGFESAEEILGRHFSTTQIAEDLPEAQSIVEKVLKGNVIPVGEFRRRRRDGSVGYHTFSVCHIRKGGEVIGLEGFLMDTSDLRRVRADYAMLFDRMLNGFALHEIICDADGGPIDYRFLDVNPAFERLTGLKAEAVVGRRVTEVLPEIEPVWIRQYGRVALTGEPASFQQHNRDLDRHFEVSAFRPAPGQFACLFADVTDRVRLEAELRQAQKMEAVGQLAGGVAHDFNNLLAGILMHLELFGSHPDLPEELRESLAELKAGAENSAGLTRQLLLFSRRQAMQATRLDLNQTVGRILKMLRRLLGEQITLRFEQKPGVCQVKADPGMMEQVVMNLCVNARDAMPGGGTLTISTDIIDASLGSRAGNPDGHRGRYVRLTIADTGIGMDQTTLQHIFEPFFTTKDAGKGTGLGLATVFGIVKQHQGWIDVQSAVGKGTSFHVHLPLCAEQTPVESEVKMSGSAMQGSETILLVEDEPGLRQVVAKALRRRGYRVLEAENGLAARKVWEENRGSIDLLYTDMVMPEGITGLALARKLRTEDPALKVIITSGYSETLGTTMAEGMANLAFLPKPSSFDVIARTVRECLDAPLSD